MRSVLAIAFVLFTGVALGAENEHQLSFLLDGKPAKVAGKSVAEGVRATVGLLESCHDESPFAAEEFKAARQADHLRLVFAKPVAANVMSQKLELSELVVRLPLNTGVVWVRAGDRWRRFSKFEYLKTVPVTAWVESARTAE